MGTLELDGVSKTYGAGKGAVRALADVTLTVGAGEFLVVVGPSGCGKTTLLRLIAGLERPGGGRITLDGRSLDGVPPQARDVAMVFQSDALYPHLTVRENVAFGLEESTGLAPEAIDDHVVEAATTVGIADLLDRRPSALSGGQRQRVALCRAIVREPAIFLLDEPLSSLDADRRSELRTELSRILASLDATTVYVTHDQTEAMTMGDRVAVLDDGCLQQIGSPLDCYHRPANRFVAGFLGDPAMNFVPVTLADGILRGEGFATPLPGSAAGSVDEGEDLVLGVRPAAIDVLPAESDEASPAAGSGSHFETTVEVVEPTGDRNVLHLAVDAATIEEAVVDETGPTLVAIHDAVAPPSVGDRLIVRIPETAIHLFDRRTGEARHHREFGGDSGLAQPLE